MGHWRRDLFFKNQRKKDKKKKERKKKNITRIYKINQISRHLLQH